MERNFARALSLVLKSEGGWSDHPSDPGGATMKGITLARVSAAAEAIIQASWAIKAMDPLPEDVTDDALWPTTA